MATTPVRKVIGTTGASGAAGYVALLAAHNTAISDAVTVAAGVTGVVTGTITISNTLLNQDSSGGLLEMTTAINYVTQS